MRRVCVASSFENNKSMKLSMSSLTKPRIIVNRGRGGHHAAGVVQVLGEANSGKRSIPMRALHGHSSLFLNTLNSFKNLVVHAFGKINQIEVIEGIPFFGRNNRINIRDLFRNRINPHVVMSVQACKLF